MTVLLFNEVKPPPKIDAFVTLHPRSEGSVVNSSVINPPAEIDSTIGIALVLEPYSSRRNLREPYSSQSTASRWIRVPLTDSKPDMFSPVTSSISVHVRKEFSGKSALMYIGAYGPSASENVAELLYPKLGLVHSVTGGRTTFTSSMNQKSQQVEPPPLPAVCCILNCELAWRAAAGRVVEYWKFDLGVPLKPAAWKVWKAIHCELAVLYLN